MDEILVIETVRDLEAVPLPGLRRESHCRPRFDDPEGGFDGEEIAGRLLLNDRLGVELAEFGCP